jgi:NADH:ubiquinone oxidoreductase subunit 3 (subunit A)
MTPAQLMVLPPEYLMEVNPNSRQLYNTLIAFIVVDTIVLILFLISTTMALGQSLVELYVLIPLGYLGVLGIALAGIRKHALLI